MPLASNNELVDRIDGVLPQTQCRQCGYDGCRPYAEALAAGVAGADRCTPGGAVVSGRVRALLGDYRPPVSLCAVLSPLPVPHLARIRDDECIGCTKCLDACPVDAIIGAAHQLHTVLAAACTGCGLCLPPCPVDCIDLNSRADLAQVWPSADAATAQVIANSAAEACTACGACVPVCPEALRPDHLLQAIQCVDDTVPLRLNRCTECNRCQEVCPSRIPLTAYFAHAKRTAAAVAYTSDVAATAQGRYAAHTVRLAHDDHPRARDRALQFAELEFLSNGDAQREIAAALARTRSLSTGSPD